MRRAIALGIAMLASLACCAGAASAAGSADGRLRGETQISFGCPGPVREGAPSCNPWHAFAQARFSLAASAADGVPVPGTSRIVVSDAHGHFSLRLAAGRYIVAALPQPHTRGGTRRIVRVRAHQATTILVRFEGFPQMV